MKNLKKELELEKIKLICKGLKMVNKSPMQMKVIAQIENINKKILSLNK